MIIKKKKNYSDILVGIKKQDDYESKAHDHVQATEACDCHECWLLLHLRL